jgi:hypothetical protein
MAYLRVEKPHFLFLEGSAGAKATADTATVMPPDASATRAGTSAVHAGTSAACVASPVDRPAAGTPHQPQALVPPPPPGLSVRGHRLTPLEGGLPPIAFLLLFFI